MLEFAFWLQNNSHQTIDFDRSDSEVSPR